MSDLPANRLVVGCNYHTKWQKNSRMRFVLVELSGNRARLQTRTTGRDFYTHIDDLIFIDTDYNIAKAKRIIKQSIKNKETV
jgi:hypothetical protein